MNALTSDVKHEAERGLILQVLVEWGLEWMPFHELRAQLTSRLGRRLPDDALGFHMNYLEQGGYAERRSLRSGRADIELLVVRATPKAVDFLEGLLPADPGISV